MSTYGGVVKEIPIMSTPIAAASALIRGDLVEIASNLAVIWGGTNPVYGVCTGDADNDLNVIPVYCGRGCSVQVRCSSGVTPAAGDLLGHDAGAGLKTSGIVAATAAAQAVGAGMNGMVEAVLL